MSTHPKTFLSPEQYLEIERAAEYKSEYYDGEMFAMAGAAASHNLLIWTLLGEFYQQVARPRCRVYTSDQRVLVSPSGLYTYPDISATCGESRFTDDREDTLTNPTLIVEVLSPSTEAYDRSRKSEKYRALESLVEYLLVASDRMHVEVFARQDDGRWLLTEFNRPEDTLELRSIGCRISLSKLYAMT